VSLPDGIIALAGVLALLLAAGFAIGLFRRGAFSPFWLLVAAGLVALNDALLTRLYGALPDAFAASDWNWQGKILALAATLAIAALPAVGWRRCGLTLVQAPGTWRACVPVALAYCAFFLVIALVFPSGPASADEVAFQLTMPGFEEEPFYRGLLLFALDRAFAGRVRFLGVDWGWGAILSCALFGLAHAFGYSQGAFSFDPMTMALTAVPSLLAVWLRLRSGSVLIPILLHNFGNSISLLV
jgi:membrane protease YdiL (CAAX protease family)